MGRACSRNWASFAARWPRNAGRALREGGSESDARLWQSGSSASKPAQLLHNGKNRACIADGGDPTDQTIGLSSALHPCETRLLLFLRELSHLEELPLLELAGRILRLLVHYGVQLEGRCHDGLLDDLEQAATVLQVHRALVALEGHPSLNAILHCLRTDPHHPCRAVLDGALKHLHDLAHLHAAERPGFLVLDAHSRRQSRLCRDLH
mmetsp:Transcript_1350/g.3772  ORF Transcript_1350/g.3772 Transcript_1350/m.3772 type:complete len:208 (-) Transcript_1350:1650-2273(-)